MYTNIIAILFLQLRNLVIINVSPLEYGHVLLVPDVDGCRPQVTMVYFTLYQMKNLLGKSKKVKAYADNIINVTKKFEFVVEKVENYVRKGENAQTV